MEQTKQPTQLFNPFRIFDRTVERRFILYPSDYHKYSKEQLNERVACQLRVFMIANTIWYLAKDVCSFLGITPDHTSRTIKSIDVSYIRHENINLGSSPLSGDGVTCSSPRNGGVTTCTRNVILLNESGVYALIQKSRTVYAQEFKKWLNEDVLPTIRTTGSYTLSPSMMDDLDEINENLDQESFGASMTDDDERRLEFEAILREKDTIIEEKEKVIDEQKTIIESRTTSLSDLMTFLVEMKAENARTAAENARTAAENACSMRDMREDIRRLSCDNQTIRAKLDLVIRDRVINTEDDGRHSTFNLYQTGENDIDAKKYPYCIIRCQRRRVRDNEKRMRSRYANATLVYSIDNPNAESLFQVLKERSRNDSIGLIFDKTSFYIDEDHANLTLNEIIALIRNIESERTNI